jgi:hypothetical protein
MRTYLIITIGALIMMCAACDKRESEQSHDTKAYEVGEKAHKVAVKTEKALETAGHEIKKEAHEAVQGWKADKSEPVKEKR